MRFATFRLAGEQLGKARVGVVSGDEITEPEEPHSMRQLIEAGEEGFDWMVRTEELRRAVLMAPVPAPGKILATIVNTQKMLGGTDVTLDRPRIDTKAPSAVIGPGEAILAPGEGVRPEVELAVVVGKKVAHAGEKEALDGIFGYTVLNDVTAPKDAKQDAYEAYRRDRASGEIRKTLVRGPLFRSKNHDTFCPMGPWIVTKDELPDTAGLRMTARFGDLVVQDGSTSEYIFAPAKIVSYLSTFLTLFPGDVVSCGSVGWTREAIGDFDPSEFVLPSGPGSLELEIEKVGKLTNPLLRV